MIFAFLMMAAAPQIPEQRDFAAYERYIKGCRVDHERSMMRLDEFARGGRYVVDEAPAYSKTLSEAERRLARAACLGFLKGVLYEAERRLEVKVKR